jgi:flavin-dependent dehydrogenase
MSGERWLMIGDASGFIDPIFSTGVFFAHKSAFLAREAIAAPLRAGNLPTAAACAHYEKTLRIGVDRVHTMVRGYYAGRFLAQILQSRTRQGTMRALTSVLAGDVYDDDNLLVRLGVI